MELTTTVKITFPNESLSGDSLGKVETIVMALKEAGKSLCFWFFMLWYSQRANNHVQPKFIFC